MALPNHENATVGESKIVDYLLSSTHPVGQHKARFFLQHGFSREDWKTLVVALRKHASEHEIAETETTALGRRYVIEGALETPDGRHPLVRSVWFLENGETRPRLITAYPRSRRKE